MLLHGDGKDGLAAKAPFDAIVVSAACDVLPAKLFSQLDVGGRLVYPRNSESGQNLVLVEKNEYGEPAITMLLPVAFVPLQ